MTYRGFCVSTLALLLALALGCSGPASPRPDATWAPPVAGQARSVPAPTPTDAEWQALESRPLHLPLVEPGRPCPVSALEEDFKDGSWSGRILGPGPLYPVMPASLPFDAAFGNPEGAWSYAKVLWLSRASYQGPALIRGRQLDGPHELRFERGPDPPASLRFPSGDTGTRAGGPAEDNENWRFLPSFTRLQAPGCYAYQVDGQGFSYVIVFERCKGIAAQARC